MYSHRPEIGPSFAPLAVVNTDNRDTKVNRRGFARALFGLAASAAAAPLVLRAQAPQKAGLRIAMAFPATDVLFAKGWDLGVSEARRSAAPFNVEVASFRIDLRASTKLGEAVAGLQRNHVAAMGSCCDDATTRALADACAGKGIVHLNCGSKSDRLRRDFCGGGTLHIQASDAMYAGARSLAPFGSAVELWNAKLERFGAAQLNDRFRAFAGSEMNGAAWCGWFAVKVLLESFLRGSGDVTRWIASGTSQFDGHKGAPLSFRSWDGQLRQPLYAIGDRIIDIPDISRSDRPAREILDTIGDDSKMRSCAAGVFI